MNYCTKCGSQHDNNATFCSVCGSRVAISEKSSLLYQKKQSDPSLTKNIVLITLCVFLIFMATFLGNMGGPIGLGNCAFLLFVSGILLFFAIRSSEDHIDTEKMDLLKTIESFSVSVVYLVVSFFISSFIGFLYQVFVFIFSLIVFLKIRKKDIATRTITEKILLAFAIFLLIFSSIAFLGFFCSIFI